jgi:hypothetical protein
MPRPLLPFPHLAGDVSQPSLPPTRRRKSIEVAEDLDAKAAPTFTPARRRREPRAGRHGHAPPRRPPRPANLPSLPLHAATGGRRRNSRAAPRPPPRRLILLPSFGGLDATPEQCLVWEPMAELQLSASPTSPAWMPRPGGASLPYQVASTCARPLGDAPPVGSTSIATNAART